jgi:hypothetical protein
MIILNCTILHENMLIVIALSGHYESMFSELQSRMQCENATGLLLLYPYHCVHVLEVWYHCLCLKILTGGPLFKKHHYSNICNTSEVHSRCFIYESFFVIVYLYNLQISLLVTVTVIAKVYGKPTTIIVIFIFIELLWERIERVVWYAYLCHFLMWCYLVVMLDNKWFGLKLYHILTLNCAIRAEWPSHSGTEVDWNHY